MTQNTDPLLLCFYAYVSGFICRYMIRIGRLVCNCKEGQGARKTDNEHFQIESCKKLKAQFTEMIYGTSAHGLDLVEHIFKKMLFNITAAHQSRIRFLTIVLNAVNGNLKVLQTKDGLTRADKRQKYLYEETIKLPMSAKYLSFFFGKEGQHIKKVCTEYNCEIRVELKTPSAHSANPTPTIVKAKTSEDLIKVRSILMDMAEQIVKKRTKHEEKVEKYKNHRIERLRYG